MFFLSSALETLGFLIFGCAIRAALVEDLGGAAAEAGGELAGVSSGAP